MGTLKIISFIFVLSTFFGTVNSLAEQTAQCGGINSSSFIRSDAANVNALMIYTYFPSGGFSGTSDIPSFASIAAQHHSDYYDEMSYDTHHVNVQVIQRPTPNQGKAFLADNSVSFYQSNLSALHTEILDKAWAENIPRFSRWTLRKSTPFKGGLATGGCFFVIYMSLKIIENTAQCPAIFISAGGELCPLINDLLRVPAI